jgi:hypothetical protein
MKVEKFTSPGSTPVRRKFWNSVASTVTSLTKQAGKNVTVNEIFGEHTVIDVDRKVAAEALGACCVGTECSQQTESGCAELGGVFLGIGIPCDPNPCGGGGTGRPCCYPGGSCVDDLSDELCAAGGGESWGSSSDHCSDFTTPCCPCWYFTGHITGTVCWSAAGGETENCTEEIDQFIDGYVAFGSTGGDFCCGKVPWGGDDNGDGTFTVHLTKGVVTDCGGFFVTPEDFTFDCGDDFDVEFDLTDYGSDCDDPCSGGVCDCDPVTTRGPICANLHFRYTQTAGMCAP